MILCGDAYSGHSFAALYFAGDKLLKVDAINQPDEFMMAKRLLVEGKTAGPTKVVDDTVNIRDIFID